MIEPGPIQDPTNVPLSRELYEHIIRGSALPILLILLVLSWFIINYMMNPKRRKARRDREIRKAVAAREALLANTSGERMPEQD